LDVSGSAAIAAFLGSSGGGHPDPLALGTGGFAIQSEGHGKTLDGIEETQGQGINFIFTATRLPGRAGGLASEKFLEDL